MELQPHLKRFVQSHNKSQTLVPDISICILFSRSWLPTPRLITCCQRGKLWCSYSSQRWDKYWYMNSSSILHTGYDSSTLFECSDGHWHPDIQKRNGKQSSERYSLLWHNFMSRPELGCYLRCFRRKRSWNSIADCKREEEKLKGKRRKADFSSSLRRQLPYWGRERSWKRIGDHRGEEERLKEKTAEAKITYHYGTSCCALRGYKLEEDRKL